MDDTPAQSRARLRTPEETIEDFSREFARLKAIEKEYQVTVLVLGVVVERLLATTGGDAVEIEDTTLTEAPDLRAWRDGDRKTVLLSIGR